jgi:hypothetical protein
MGDVSDSLLLVDQGQDPRETIEPFLLFTLRLWQPL